VWIAKSTDEALGQAIVFGGGRLGRVGLMSTAVEDCLHTTDSRRRDTSSRPVPWGQLVAAGWQLGMPRTHARVSSRIVCEANRRLGEIAPR